jgi:predicted enzyme related to lactoylglutathione lyase
VCHIVYSVVYVSGDYSLCSFRSYVTFSNLKKNSFIGSHVVSLAKKSLEIRTEILYNIFVQRKVLMKKITQLAIIPILVADQDEALRFFTEKLELEKRADMIYGPGLRWLTVAPKGQKKPEIALAKPDLSLPGIQNNGGERMSSGTQWSFPCRHSDAGGEGGERVERLSQYITCVFATDDCYKTYHTLLARGVTFLSPPTKNVHGTEAVFEDPYGNLFSLLEPSPEAHSRYRNQSITTAA